MTPTELSAIPIWPAFLPVVSTMGGAGYHEALLRTSHPAGHGSLIRAAEQDGTMWCLDSRMLSEAIGLLARTHSNLRVGINVSAVTVQQRMDTWLAKLARSRQYASRLVVELTETAAHADAGKALRFAAACRAMGAKVAVDDYDSGLFDDGLVTLLRPDFIKLGNVWRGASGSDARSRLATALHHLGGIRCDSVVVEWVDTEEKLDAARSLCVSHVQGSYVGGHSDLDTVAACFGAMQKVVRVA